MKNQRHNEALMHLVALKLKAYESQKVLLKPRLIDFQVYIWDASNLATLILQLVPYRHYANSMIFLLRISLIR